MPYESVDKLQKVLAQEVFNHTKDPKKASGRALGTLVEIITYYLLKTWGLNNQISIERGLSEYGNPEISHNVEFSLHPIMSSSTLVMKKSDLHRYTASSILKALENKGFNSIKYVKTTNQLLNNSILRNACTIAISNDSFLLCSFKSYEGENVELHIYEQSKKPYSMFECKRVGVEEGMTKGPQTIEKAKQGAYVARTTSSLQKIRTNAGVLQGIIFKNDGTHLTKPFIELLEEVINSNDQELLKEFILSVGVVSNHGNWFTAENHNKEMKVLAQSYDWLLFLSDKGLAEFIENLLLNPINEYSYLREVFLASYKEGKKKNAFTKVQMDLKADRLLLNY